MGAAGCCNLSDSGYHSVIPDQRVYAWMMQASVLVCLGALLCFCGAGFFMQQMFILDVHAESKNYYTISFYAFELLSLAGAKGESSFL